MRVPIAIAVLLFAPMVAADPNTTSLRTDAQTNLRSMEGNASRVQHALLMARASSQALETRCLDVTLSRADAAVRLGREDLRLANLALDAGDMIEARRQLLHLAAQREASRNAVKDADNCAHGAPALVVPSDQTIVRVVVDQVLPSDTALFPARP